MTHVDRAQNTRRWWLWIPLLGVAAWLAVFGDKSPDAGAISLPTRSVAKEPGSAPVARTSWRAASQAVAETSFALVPRAQLIPAAASSAPTVMRDPFSARNWNPPPPSAAAAPQPAAPVAPPLPYTFIGKKQEGETWEVYLTRGESTFVARENEVLEGSYRIDKIAPPTLSLTYLPLGQVQTLAIGETR